MILCYVAAPFEEQENARKLRAALAERGIGCTSRWLEEEPSLGNLPKSDEDKAKFARMDRYDMRRAQAVVLWNPSDYARSGTGGRHVETGMAFSLAEMPVFVVGARTNIFAWLPEVVFVDVRVGFSDATWVERLVAHIKDRCPDFGPTWDSPADQAAKGVTLSPEEKARLDRQIKCEHKVTGPDAMKIRRVCYHCDAVVGGAAP